MNQTPNANRLHIAIFGRRNSGKSSLINAITGGDAALVSAVAGTTTDTVAKAMEIEPLGACLIIDTPGFDDDTQLGEGRIERTRRTVERTDIALMLFDGEDLSLEKLWCEDLRRANIPIVAIISKADSRKDSEELRAKIEKQLALRPLLLSAVQGFDLEPIRQALIELEPEKDTPTILGNLVERGDSVLLVMPQDRQAPKGRLILPQVQTLRELLDRGCVVSCSTTELFSQALVSLAEPPKLIVTDSQAFSEVYAKAPNGSSVTSFSILMAGYKGDIGAFVDGAKAIDSLTPKSKVLIAEACTHAPLSEDIGREKLPRLLRQRIGEGLQIDIVAGREFPDNLQAYDVVIHCGGCTFNRKYMMQRVGVARSQGVPITNYGVVLAHLNGILDRVVLP